MSWETLPSRKNGSNEGWQVLQFMNNYWGKLIGALI